METPIGTIETNFLQELEQLIIRYKEEYNPQNYNDVKIYMSKAMNMEICREASKLWGYHPLILRECMGYDILPGYDLMKITIIDIEDISLKKIKQICFTLSA